jgi:hypothetical protein
MSGGNQLFAEANSSATTVVTDKRMRGDPG